MSHMLFVVFIDAESRAGSQTQTAHTSVVSGRLNITLVTSERSRHRSILCVACLFFFPGVVVRNHKKCSSFIDVDGHFCAALGLKVKHECLL